MADYYVIRNKETGFYFRGKGENRWGKYHNQASVYRMKAHAENTYIWLSLRGEPVEIVPIQIVENPTDIAEVVRCIDCKHWMKDVAGCTDLVGRCERANYMVGAAGYCVYGERKDHD